jgi:tetratricopeptide (TPR) repeat protein
MNIDSQKKRAWKLFNNNKLDEAIQLCEQIQTADAEVFFLIGWCCNGTGQYVRAVDAFQESLKIKPDAPVTLLKLGRALVKLDRCEEAVEKYRLALKIKPKMSKAHCALANALSFLELTKEAEEHYKKAIKLNPDMPTAQIGLAKLYWSAGNNIEKAIDIIKTAILLKPKNISYRCMLGNALMDGHRIDESFACFSEVIRVDAENPSAIAGMARLYNLKGQYDKSMEQIEKLRNKKIYNTMAAIAFTSICKHLHNCEDAITYAQKSLENNHNDKNTDEALYMHVARALDSLERYDEAWQCFTKGNGLTEGLYDTAGHRLRAESMISVFSHANTMGMVKSSIDSKRPIFIVGMPRSGTSLVEQILSAHPDVCGGGELTHISDLRAIIMQQAGLDKKWPDCAFGLRQDDLNRLAATYLDRLNEISDSAKRITDKMPHNFFELGLIQMLFPQAHIIHCNRDPMDTCLSIYFQNFLDGHDYSRNLYHIGAHYHQYLKLMAHWRSHLSMPFLDVQYEELVSNPEAIVRQMLNHCDLEWYDGCLDFHKVKRMVHTASFDQVRQPMYKKSVQRWRHYEKHLHLLEEGLERGL